MQRLVNLIAFDSPVSDEDLAAAQDAGIKLITLEDVISKGKEESSKMSIKVP